MANCQCHVRYHACFVKKDRNNKPAWRCMQCDAFQRFMNKDESRRFRATYFRLGTAGRKRLLRNYTIKPDQPVEEEKQETVVPTTGTQLTLDF